jgi:hypothetical protein
MTNTQGRWAKDEALMYNVNRLPEHVLDVHPHDKSEVVMLRRGIVGFYRQTLLAGPAEARKYADDCNRRAKVSPHVLEAMRHGALFGFGTPGADPDYQQAALAKDQLGQRRVLDFWKARLGEVPNWLALEHEHVEEPSKVQKRLAEELWMYTHDDDRYLGSRLEFLKEVAERIDADIQALEEQEG